MALEKLLPEDKKIVVIPMDDGLLDGPVGGLVDMPGKVKQIVEGGADAILGFLGVYKQCKDHLKKTKFILNVTASTKYSMNPQQKVQLYDVSQAVDLGINGIAVHVNVGSVHLHDQLQILGRVAADCTKYGIPLLAIAYPRGEMIREDALPEATAYAARMAAEAGADIVKTKYTGSIETFKDVVNGCPVPVIMAGGPKIPEEQILANIESCMKAGGKGVAIGRNSFHHENTTEFVKKVYGIVHGKN